MGGKKGKSGPPNNLNASKYSWRSLWRRSMVHERDAWVRQPVERYCAALLSDKPDPTAGEASMIEIAGLARGCTLLILSELKRSGFTRCVDGAVELSPAAAELNRFMLTELSALKAVGLGRRAKQVTSLAEYLSNGKAPAATNTTPSTEQVTPSSPPST